MRGVLVLHRPQWLNLWSHAAHLGCLHLHKRLFHPFLWWSQCRFLCHFPISRITKTANLKETTIKNESVANSLHEALSWNRFLELSVRTKTSFNIIIWGILTKKEKNAGGPEVSAPQQDKSGRRKWKSEMLLCLNLNWSRDQQVRLQIGGFTVQLWMWSKLSYKQSPAGTTFHIWWEESVLFQMFFCLLVSCTSHLKIAFPETKT